MLSLKNVTKSYGKFDAVKEVSFQVDNGEIAVLLGPNGAGKSTTIKSIIGVLKHKGEILLDGENNKTVKAKKSYAYIPETPAMYEMLTVYEHLEFIASAYGIKNYDSKAEELLKRFELWDKKDKLGKELSKGMQQKVSICCGLLIEPKIVLFDEPMIGLDPKAIKELKQVFLELKEKGCSVIISTHIIDSIDELWDKALIMKEGSIILARTREELLEKGESLEEIFFEVTEG